MLRTDALDYHLPPDCIATHPAEPRDSARLLVVRRDEPGCVEHARVRDLPSFLARGDRIVVNTTRVLPARFLGVREDTGGKVEGLYLHDAPGDSRAWVAMIKSRRHRADAPVRLHTPHGPSPYMLRMRAPVDDPPGAWIVSVHSDDGSHPHDAPAVLAAVGRTPLPPYILHARREGGDAGDETADRAQYQTVYAEAEAGSSVAAPTAGLHFTPGLLAELREHGIPRSDVQLHVGAGTFKPVETECIEQHPIHAEWCTMSAETIAEIALTRAHGGRVVAVGTTSVRTIESYAAALRPEPSDGAQPPPPDHLLTRLMLTPGQPFTWTDALLTNFHLPRSTLMALVAAMLQAPDEPPAPDGTPVGVTRLLAVYREAIEHRYRFYSFGDAMLVI